ncbi:hypothetical protein TI03_07520, partial [Achromatium sp. WMS1]
WLIALTLWKIVNNSEFEQAKIDFGAEVIENMVKIQHRIKTYEHIVHMGAAFIRSNREIDYRGWQDFFINSPIHKYFPGIAYIGWIELTSATTSKVTFLDPMDTEGKRVVGQDMLQESMYKTAMFKARDSGQATISSKITTEQGIIDATQADNILYIPVYQQGAPTGTISER